MENEKIFAGLDIGTTKIAVIVGKLDEYGRVNIIGVGQTPSQGLRRGVVIDIDKTVHSVTLAIEQAELICGHKINSVYAGIAGDHIRSINSKGVIAVSGKDKIITEDDVRRVIDAAQAIAVPMDREILHVLPQEYIVDDQDGIHNPVKLAGVRLEAEVHIVTAAAASAQNIVNCIHIAGYEVEDIVLEPYASSLAVLDENERNLGVCIIDIGGGTTDIAMFFDGSIRHTSVIGLGGQHITNDLAQGLRTTLDQAEEIKKKYGLALQSMLEKDELIKVPGVGGRMPREIARSLLVDIIQPRMEEMFQFALNEMKKSNVFDSLGAGVVLTGGASLVPGAAELAEKTMGMPVKIGMPIVQGGLVETVRNPIFATGVGLVYYALQHEAPQQKSRKTEAGKKIKLSDIPQRLREIFENLFG
jgi:cell division protein FtsA